MALDKATDEVVKNSVYFFIIFFLMRTYEIVKSSVLISAGIDEIDLLGAYN